MLDISNFPWAECSISENRIMYIGDSLSLRRKKRNKGIQRYEFELVTIDMEMRQGRGVKARLSAAVDDVLTFVHPRLSFAQGKAPTTPLVASGTNIAGAKIISITSTTEWQLLAGDLIQFSNDTKVYETAEDTNLTFGTQSVELTFPLRKTISAGSVIKMNDITWHLESNGVIETSMDASDNQDMELTLVAVEKL